ncbi:MAG: hypothetical protein RLZ98_15 [Pseudomonadota bacterium]|jgi:uncharacterized membrane protein (DUF4010 family)
MDTVELVERMSVALAIGLLIGVERGWHEREEPEGSRTAGIRTHALAGLLGGVFGAVASGLGSGGPVLLGMAFFTFSLAIVVFRIRETISEGTFGATTVVAIMLAFALGALAVLGDLQAAAAAGIAATGLLAAKRLLHDWLRRITWPELRSGLLLLAMTFVLLPLLPDRDVDPWQSLNPHRIWLMTIAIAAISFAGYAAVRIAGKHRGILFTGLAGGIVSSTAVTVTLARLARVHKEHTSLLAAGVTLASATMMLRVIAIVGLFNKALLSDLLVPLSAATAVLLAAAFLNFRQAQAPAANDHEMTLDNPFDLRIVLQFGALLAVVLLLSRLASRMLGDVGVLALSVVSGLADVDAITLSMSRLAGGEIALQTGALAIALAVATNMLSKCALAAWAGGHAIGARFALASLAALAAGIAPIAAGISRI